MIIGPNIVTDGLVFGYDADDRSTRFYKGEPTTNEANTDTARTLVVHGGYGHVATFSDAPERGDGWKKVTVVTIGTNYRICQFPYITQNSTTKTYSIEYDFNGNTGYYWRVDGIAGMAMDYSNGNKSVKTYTNSTTQYEAIFLNNDNINRTNVNEVIYYRYYQVEQKPHPTQFVTGTRGATESLIDLKKTTTIDVSNVSFDSTAHPTFDGIDDVIRTTYAPQLGNFTICVVFKDEGSMSWGRIVDKSYTNGVFISSQFASGGVNYIGAGIIEPNPPYGQSLPYTSGKYHFFTVVRSGTTHKIYLDGITQTLSKTGSSALLSTTAFAFGSWSAYNNQLFKGKLPIVKIYNKALSDTDVLQNYNAYKKRFNL